MTAHSNGRHFLYNSRALHFDVAALGNLHGFAADSGCSWALPPFLRAQKSREALRKSEQPYPWGEPPLTKVADKYVELIKACIVGMRGKAVSRELCQALGSFAAAEVMYSSDSDLERLNTQSIAKLAKVFLQVVREIDAKSLCLLFRSYDGIRRAGASLSLIEILSCRSAGFKDNTGFLLFVEALQPIGKLLTSPEFLGGSLKEIAKALLPLCNTRVNYLSRKASVIEAARMNSPRGSEIELLSPTAIQASKMTVLQVAKLLAQFDRCPNFVSSNVDHGCNYSNLASFLGFTKSERGVALLERWPWLDNPGIELFNIVFKCSRGLSSAQLDRQIAAAELVGTFESLSRQRAQAFQEILNVLPESPDQCVEVGIFLRNEIREGRIAPRGKPLSFNETIRLISDTAKQSDLLPILEFEDQQEADDTP